MAGLGRVSKSSLALLAALLLAPKAASGLDARAPRLLLVERSRVAAVTVMLPLRSCAGSIAGGRTQVLTAAHCIPEGVEELDVVFRGRNLRAMVALIDRTRDTALLALDEELDVQPLELSVDLPKRGDRVLFVGRTDRPSKTQIAHVVKLGRCPSLPGVSDAVFTDLDAKPGDSGAPIVDSKLRIVGVIHGGASCHIAAPTATLARELAASASRSAAPGEAQPE